MSIGMANNNNSLALTNDADPALVSKAAKDPNFLKHPSDGYERLDFADAFAKAEQDTSLGPFFERLEVFRQNDEFCDVIVQLDTVAFAAHRVVLAAASPYLHRKLLENPKKVWVTANATDEKDEDTMQRRTYQVSLFYQDPFIVENILKFIYTRKLNLTPVNALELYRLASVLEMQDAMDISLRYLVDGMTDNNVFERLAFAIDKNAPAIRDAAIRFLCADFWHSRFMSSFFRLEYDAIRRILETGLCGSIHEDHVLDVVVNWVRNLPANRAFLEKLFDLVQLPLLSSIAIGEALGQVDSVFTKSLHCRERLHNPKHYQKSSNFASIAPRGGTIFAVGRPVFGFEHIFEIYDPIGNTWRSGPKIANYQFGAEMKMCTFGTSIVMIGDRFVRPSPTSMIYDIVEEKWFEMAPPIPPRLGMALCSVPHLEAIVQLGGHSAADWIKGAFSSVLMYRKSTGHWEMLPSMNTPRKHACAVAFRDRLFAIGGNDGFGPTRNFEYFSFSDAATGHGNWVQLAPMHAGRYMAGAVIAGNRLYVGGGYNNITRAGDYNAIPLPQSSVEFYDFDKLRWYQGETMWHGRGNFDLVASGGSLYAVGGYDSEVEPGYSCASVERLDLRSNHWQKVASLNEGKGATVATCVFYRR